MFFFSAIMATKFRVLDLIDFASQLEYRSFSVFELIVFICNNPNLRLNEYPHYCESLNF